MTTTSELAHLFRRDLEKLRRQVEAFPNDELLWQTLPGVTKAAGNLALHIEGNLREFIGRQEAHGGWLLVSARISKCAILELGNG
jgi:hypothetical protein